MGVWVVYTRAQPNPYSDDYAYDAPFGMFEYVLAPFSELEISLTLPVV